MEEKTEEDKKIIEQFVGQFDLENLEIEPSLHNFELLSSDVLAIDGSYVSRFIFKSDFLLEYSYFPSEFLFDKFETFSSLNSGYKGIILDLLLFLQISSCMDSLNNLFEL